MSEQPYDPEHPEDLHGMAERWDAERSEQQEWREVTCPNPECGLVFRVQDYNAALAAGQLRLQETDDANRLTCENTELRQQLLSAQAAIEKIIEAVPPFEFVLIIEGREVWLHDFLKSVNLSALYQHDDEVRKSLVDALAWYATATYPDDSSGRPPESFQKRAKDALAKVKEGE